MRRSLPLLLILVLAAPAAAAEVGARADVPMDRVPWELAEPRLESTVWWDQPHIPFDHPYWWTLTDSITPMELKSRIDSMMAEGAAEAERRRAAAGSTGEHSSVTVTLSGEDTPELFPMWVVLLDWFELNRIRRGASETAIAELVDFGFQATTAAMVVEVTRAKFDEAAAGSTQVIEDALQMIELRARAKEKLGAEGLERMQNTNDFALFSAQVGWSQEALRELALSAKRKPGAEAAVAATATLHQRLEPNEWEHLRRFLLVKIAPGITQGAGFW